MVVKFTNTLDPSGAPPTHDAVARWVVVKGGAGGNSNVRLVTIAGIGTRRVVPAGRSNMKGRSQAGGPRSQLTVSGSLLSRADAEMNAITLPSSLIAGARLARSACPPDVDWLTSVSALDCRSSRNTSPTSLVSLAIRFDASETKTTHRPSPLILGW